MKLVLMDEAGEIVLPDPSLQGNRLTMKMLAIFAECIMLQRRKAVNYGDAWRSQGSMGNLARVLSKASRLRQMLWSDVQIDNAEESVDDTIYDLINLACFLMINRRDRNKWGDQ